MKSKNSIHNYFEITKVSEDGTETSYNAYNIVTNSGLSAIFRGLPAASTGINLTKCIAQVVGVRSTAER